MGIVCLNWFKHVFHLDCESGSYDYVPHAGIPFLQTTSTEQ